MRATIPNPYLHSAASLDRFAYNMADADAFAAAKRQEELQKQLQTLQVLESELKSLPVNAKVYNAITTQLEAPLIPHAHAQHAMFPNLDAKSALQDVQRQKRVLLANLGQPQDSAPSADPTAHCADSTLRRARTLLCSMYRPLPCAVSALPKRLASTAARHHVSRQLLPPLLSRTRARSLHTSSSLRADAAAAATKPASSTPASTTSASYTDGGPAVPGVTTDAKSRAVYITWASGITSKFHNIWLRDHCRCPQCYHPTTKQRLLNTFEIAPDAQPASAEATTEGLLIHWPLLPSERAATPSSPVPEPAQEGQPLQGESASGPLHASLYPWRWLMRNSYSPLLSDPVTAGSDESGLKGIEKVLWGKGIGSAPPTVKYEEVMQSDQGVLKWVTKIAQYGFAFVSGVPPTPTDTEALIRRIAFIRETHYGGFWDFTSDLAHGDTAYTDLALQAHTDTTYFTDPAGLQMFHLLSHTASKTSSSSATGGGGATRGPSGGESLLVDGFLAAAVLKDVHPEAYETLSRVRIRTHSAGDENTMIRPLLDGGYPILQHDDATGELVLVRYNNDDRSVLRVDADDVEPFYDALVKWNAILTNPEGEYRVQLKPGTPLIFDNHRVLHGRAAFVGNRRLCGAYVNHDDYRSRLAVLRTQLAENRTTRGVWDDGL